MTLKTLTLGVVHRQLITLLMGNIDKEPTIYIARSIRAIEKALNLREIRWLIKKKLEGKKEDNTSQGLSWEELCEIEEGKTESFSLDNIFLEFIKTELSDQMSGWNEAILQDGSKIKTSVPMIMMVTAAELDEALEEALK